MNTGIQDAVNLAWKLGLVIQGQASARLLDSYEAERRLVALAVRRGTDLATRMVTLRNPVACGVRNFLIRGATRLTGFRRKITRQVSELGVRYRKSPIAGEEWPLVGSRGGVKPGERLPDFPLQPIASSAGTGEHLFHLLKFPRHHLLLLSGMERAVEIVGLFAQIRESISEKFRGGIESHFIFAFPPSFALPGRSWIDPGGALHKALGATSSALFLVRPDGCLGYRCQPAALKPLVDYLEKKVGFIQLKS